MSEVGAAEIGASTIWWQSGADADGHGDPRGVHVSAEDSARARGIVEATGLRYVDDAYLPDAVRALTASLGG